jgi:mannose-1-phosphate guanylyltransferase/phosphomannomutase
VVRETVPTPWEQKGTVMRTLVERSGDKDLILVDGVKIIIDDGWVLVLPDPEDPLTHIWAEAATSADARSLAQQYARTIRQILNE